MATIIRLVEGNIEIPDTISSITGNLKIGDIAVHGFGTSNAFLGDLAGNYTLTGAGNNGFGQQVFSNLTTGTENTGMGNDSLKLVTSGNFNTAFGSCALCAITTETFNTAVGINALSNAAGDSNVALGANAGVNLLTGDHNIYIGNRGTPSESNTIRIGNTDHTDTYLFGDVTLTSNLTLPYSNIPKTEGVVTIGIYSLYADIESNVAFGDVSFGSLTTGEQNTAMGQNSSASLTSGNQNVSIGHDSLQSCTTGINNTAIGVDTLSDNVSGSNNTALGWSSLVNCTGNYNIGIGTDGGCLLTTGDYNICIGGDGVAGESNTIRIGDGTNYNTTYLYGDIIASGIFGSTSSGGTAVFVNSSGVLGTLTSSIKTKTNIAPMDSSALYKLKPVQFEYKKDLGHRQYGLIAEEVYKIDPQLIIYDNQGDINTVKYHDINIMMLSEIQRLNKELVELRTELNMSNQKNKEHESTIDMLISQVTANNKRIDRLADLFESMSVRSNL
ncbi:MAG: hypothetical protein GY751_00365 [Bacteroidetes bacterium]|nr:hypothetical protein [Bacteroidota bacterium]